jgi:hypothetical protein
LHKYHYTIVLYSLCDNTYPAEDKSKQIYLLDKVLFNFQVMTQNNYILHIHHVWILSQQSQNKTHRFLFFFFVSFIFASKGIWTQDSMLARQVLYHLSHVHSPFCFSYFSFLTFAWACLRPWFYYLYPPMWLGP